MITGKITGFPDSTKIYLKNINLDEDIDSTFLVKDSFQFKGKFQQDSVPEQLWLYLRLNEGKEFYYTNLLVKNNDTIVITGNKDDFPDYINKTGSRTQEVANSLNVLTRDLEAKYSKLINEFFALNEKDKETKGKKLIAEFNNIRNEIQQIEKDFLKKNYNTFYGVIKLSYYKKMFPKDTLKMMIENLNPTIRNSKYGQVIETYVNSKIVDENDKFYNFTAQDQKGNKVNFADLFEKDKYILLDFTATYCGPCVLSAKELKEINNKYSDKVKIVSFNVDPKKEVWEKGLKRDKVDWVSLWDGKGNFSKTYIKYGIQGVPTFFLINPEGIVIKKERGYGENLLTKMLKENGVIPKD